MSGKSNELALPRSFGSQQWSNEDSFNIGSCLSKKLGKDNLASRVGAGNSRFTYIESWRSIQLANTIFGFNGWSCSVVDISPDFIEEDKGRFSVGVTAVVRVTLKDGTFHEDVGYGTAENPKRGPAIEKAKKEAVSDARKRCLRLYGDALGNCLYDKSHLKRIKSSAGNTGDDLLDYKAISTQSVKSESVISEETSSSPQTSPSHSNTTPIVKSEPKQNNTSPIKSSNSLPNTRLPLPKSAPYSKPQSGNNGKSQIPAQIKTFSPAKKLPPPAYCNQSVQNGFQQLNTASVKLQPKTTQTPNLQPHQSFDNFSDVDMAAFEAAEQSYQQYQPTQV